MGKASRKLKKKQQQEEAVGRQGEIKGLEEKLQSEIEQEAYSDALDTLAEIVGKGTPSPSAMYAGAYAYFMLGDYDRSASWIDNTLRFAPGHVAARILLARLCILQEKVDAGLALFELLTDKFLAGLSDEEKDEIESLSGFYGRNEPERIRKEYPHLAKFLRLDEEEEKTAAPEAVASQSSAAPATGKSALEILRSLKQKIEARAHNEQAPAPQEPTAAPAVSVVRPEENMTASPEAEAVAEPEKSLETGGTEEARRKLREVLDSRNSIAEKVRILDSFAGGYYAQEDLESAELFLKEALKFDETDDGLLRNLAVLLAEKGEKEKAFQVAARMHQTNFLLLQAIRGM